MPVSSLLAEIRRPELESMTRVGIMALGWERAYWRKGVARMTTGELVNWFLSAQRGDVDVWRE